MNSINLVGRIVKKGELKTNSSSSILNIRIAVDRNFKNANGVRETDFIPIVLLGKLAESVYDYLDIGRLIGITGRLQVHNYPEGDNIKYFTEVIATEIKFLDSRKVNTAV